MFFSNISLWIKFLFIMIVLTLIILMFKKEIKDWLKKLSYNDEVEDDEKNNSI